MTEASPGLQVLGRKLLNECEDVKNEIGPDHHSSQNARLICFPRAGRQISPSCRSCCGEGLTARRPPHAALPLRSMRLGDQGRMTPISHTIVLHDRTPRIVDPITAQVMS